MFIQLMGDTVSNKDETSNEEMDKIRTTIDEFGKTPLGTLLIIAISVLISGWLFY